MIAESAEYASAIFPMSGRHLKRLKMIGDPRAGPQTKRWPRSLRRKDRAVMISRLDQWIADVMPRRGPVADSPKSIWTAGLAFDKMPGNSAVGTRLFWNTIL